MILYELTNDTALRGIIIVVHIYLLNILLIVELWRGNEHDCSKKLIREKVLSLRLFSIVQKWETRRH